MLNSWFTTRHDNKTTPGRKKATNIKTQRLLFCRKHRDGFELVTFEFFPQLLSIFLTSNSELSSHLLVTLSSVFWISWEVTVYRDPHAVLRSSNQLMLSFGWHHTKVVCNIMRCMMRFFQIISMLSMLWIFFHLPRKHCDVSDAITELHTWTITPSMENKVYPVIV